jgi:lipopolysaccharide transport system ATP-binding protein
MRAAIQIEGLGKKYRVSHGRPRGNYRTLRESLIEAAGAPLRRLRRTHTSSTEDFWALKDVSFDVHPGEVVGIIGRNGAGKSTLLKILSRITKPTTGRVQINGRVGSLLEVGTGFHPELTGRENIFLNGSILGMSKREVARKFDEIVAFAEVERFLDTPVKRYSSGMYVRLAFAVAAHLEPEILIVDEVLAVGDLQFQKKCLGRMGEVAKAGRTVLFVSHNLAALQNLCGTGQVLARGQLAFSGEVGEAVQFHIGDVECSHGGDIDLTEHAARTVGAIPMFDRIRLLDDSGRSKDTFESGDTLVIELRIFAGERVDDPQIGIGVNDRLGQRVFTVGSYHSLTLPTVAGSDVVRCRIDDLPLAPGAYSLTLAGGPVGNSTQDWLQYAVGFRVVESDFYGSGRLPAASQGNTLVRSTWETKLTPKDEQR